MTNLGLPVQFLNLGGEMMYIVDQRLRSQDIPYAKANTVRNDILSVMLGQQFIKELFQPQLIYTLPALRKIFEKLVHASIMKMNDTSMNKLFDLMLMSLKHQLISVSSPRDLFWVTLNHLDAMMSFATVPVVQESTAIARNLFIKMYVNLDVNSWINVRRDLLNFVQDVKIRVSVFLKTGIQNHFGQLTINHGGNVGAGSEIPGIIRLFDPKSKTPLVTLFPSGGTYLSSHDDSQWIQMGYKRDIKLGLNLYNDTERDLCLPLGHTTVSKPEEASNQDVFLKGTSEGREELNLLYQLIGPTQNMTTSKELKLNITIGEDEPVKSESFEHEVSAKGSSTSNIITIETHERKDHPELEKVLCDLYMDDSTRDLTLDPVEADNNDLLELLDSS